MFELTRVEQEYIVNVLRSAHTELLRDLHHADCRHFRQTLRSVIELNERVTDKVSETAPPVLDRSERNQRSAEH